MSNEHVENVETTTKNLFNMQRFEKESFAAYKERMKIANKLLKERLKGVVVPYDKHVDQKSLENLAKEYKKIAKK